MSFFHKYELVRLLREGQSKSFEARERASGKPVLFHMLSPESLGGAVRLDESLRRLAGSPQVIEVGEFAGAPYLVTERIPGLESIETWIREQAAAAPGPAAEQSRPPVADLPSPPAPGEFTRLFEGAPAAAKAEAAEDRPEADAAAGEPGEFTRYFLGLAPKERLPAEAGKPASSPMAAAPQWPGSGGEPGDFTRFFGPGLGGQPVDVEEELARPQAASDLSARPFAQPGEFTRMFGLPPGSRKEPAESPLETLLATSSELLAPEQKIAPADAPPEGVADSAERPISEYTRVVSSPQPSEGAEAQPAGQVQTAPPAQTPRAQGPRRWVMPVLIAAATILLAILVVLLATGRKKEGMERGAMGINSPAAAIR